MLGKNRKDAIERYGCIIPQNDCTKHSHADKPQNDCTNIGPRVNNNIGYIPMRYNRKAKAAQLSAFFAFFFSIIQSCKILLPNTTALGQETLSLVILIIL